MTVWVVMRGEQYEGGYIHGMFSNYPAACACANDIIDHPIFDEGWHRVPEYGFDYWECGCDFMAIHEIEVKDKYDSPFKKGDVSTE